jgi:hypothetical protein
LERHNEATELYLLWKRERERQRDKERLSHHECPQVVTFFVPNFCKLSTAIIITKYSCKSWGKFVCGDMSRDTIIFFIFIFFLFRL